MAVFILGIKSSQQEFHFYCQSPSIPSVQRVFYTIYGALSGNLTLFSLNGIKYQEDSRLNLQRKDREALEERESMSLHQAAA